MSKQPYSGVIVLNHMKTDSHDRDQVIPLETANAVLQETGGKGLNLSRLIRAGFPVPDGFIVTTRAYDSFLDTNRIRDPITVELARLDGESSPPQQLVEEIAARIGELFRSGTPSLEVLEKILDAYKRLGGPPVAVRSSATTEDLPELSFAGQQDSFLNVIGEDRLVRAVLDCWSSLWTARAIRYRLHNRIPQGAISLAVVIQRMIESESSGVMFTANPVTGQRTQIVIEAVRGLGEALVSGRTEPDRFTIDVENLHVVDRSIGGTETGNREDGAGTRQPAIDDRQALRLASLGVEVAALYGTPQDIEWTYADGNPYILQSRAITSLFPLPAGMRAQPLQVMFSFSAIQGLMDPITPFGADMLRLVFASVARSFGPHRTPSTQRVLFSAGGRLWVNFTPLLRNTVGRRFVRGALGLIEPTIQQALDSLWQEPRLQPKRKGIRPRTAIHVARFFLPVARNVLLNLVAPQVRHRRLTERTERLLQDIDRSSFGRSGTANDRTSETLSTLEAFFSKRVAPTFARLVSGIAAGMVSLNLLNRIAKRVALDEDRPRKGMSDLVLEITRSTPFNPTTEMDLHLWRIAKGVRNDPHTARLFVQSDPHELSRRYRQRAFSRELQTAFDHFLDRYGARGLAEIDAGRPRWRDEPEHLFEIVARYLRIDDPDRSPDALEKRNVAAAETAIHRLTEAARASGRGLPALLRAGLVRFAARRARMFLGFREYPKFFAVRMMDVFRRRFLGIAADLVMQGTLSRPDDFFLLTFSELASFSEGTVGQQEIANLVASRREERRRELSRHRIPRLLLSDGRAFYEGITLPSQTDAGETLLGGPVSPGSAEGRVRVVLDPRDSGLQSGEIMVCRGTDPSWTPLFLIAAGLIMEVGGMMTHGAVVAREYGLPAVVGVHNATERLKTGDRVRLDGSNGQVTRLA